MKINFRHTVLSLLTTTLLTTLSSYAVADTTVQILSATIKDQKLSAVNATLQRNGEQSVFSTTNATGKVTLNNAFPDDASTLLILKKAGYSNLVVKCPCAGMTYAMSPVMTNLDGLRIVLNWGATPSDLDSHVVYPNNHVYFSQKKGADANLDVDDTTSYGPETITIEQKHDGERYVYAVHDFTNRSNMQDRALSASGAKVFVYVGQTLIRTYYVPKNKVGNLWTVFAITENGDFQDYNSIESVTSEDRLNTQAFQNVVNHSQVARVVTSQAQATSAQDLNRQGEIAYHAKNLELAISLYQSAIEQQADYGQAYSNLGLAFQKAGRSSEALWANRKAIALANGADANIVRASSHYNNARIYEASSQWTNALREYQQAKNENTNKAYDQGILRMKAKGAR